MGNIAVMRYSNVLLNHMQTAFLFVFPFWPLPFEFEYLLQRFLT